MESRNKENKIEEIEKIHMSYCKSIADPNTDKGLRMEQFYDDILKWSEKQNEEIKKKLYWDLVGEFNNKNTVIKNKIYILLPKAFKAMRDVMNLPLVHSWKSDPLQNKKYLDNLQNNNTKENE
jgi:hypothetical protein